MTKNSIGRRTAIAGVLGGVAAAHSRIAWAADPIKIGFSIPQSGGLAAIGRQALFDPFWALHAAQELGCDADFAMWTPEYGWWLDKRKNNLVGIKK